MSDPARALSKPKWRPLVPGARAVERQRLRHTPAQWPIWGCGGRLARADGFGRRGPLISLSSLGNAACSPNLLFEPTGRFSTTPGLASVAATTQGSSVSLAAPWWNRLLSAPQPPAPPSLRAPRSPHKKPIDVNFRDQLTRITAMMTTNEMLGRAVFDRWAELPRDVQEMLFAAAVAHAPEATERLATELHDRHPRTSHPSAPAQ